MLLNTVKKGHARVLATSLTALLFLIIGGSGVLMFFHLFESYVKELHEILGLFFVAAVLFHLFYNWGGMRRYFPKKIFVVTALAVLTATSAFLLSAEGGENPKVVIIEAVLGAPLGEVSRLLGVDSQEATQRLAEEGFILSGQGTIIDIAKSNERSPFEVIQLIRQQ